ncbi:hypothetical protein [Candidatus Amarolinea aalborgensis]|uniref:hypothetical protein n=1 Tax=Candidatus Amarolinea aalborgensis TaxID=2249329 RepID=UPI003BF96BFB
MSGSIPSELGNMSSLLGLELSDNQLSGEVPAELMQPPYLYSVSVDYNMVTPTDPTVVAWLDMVDPGGSTPRRCRRAMYRPPWSPAKA